MKRKIISALCFAALILFANESLSQDLSYLKYTNRVKRISPNEAFLKYKTGKCVFVDSMNPKTYKKYHIVGAISMPGDGPKWFRRILNAKINLAKNQEMIVYCD